MGASTIGSTRPLPLYRVILAASIGNTLEWFDFLIYGYFAVTIAKLFFPTGNETVSLLLTLGTFGASYVVRPLGAIVIGAFTRPRRPQGRTDLVDPADDDRHDDDRGDADLRDDRHCRPDPHSVCTPLAGLFGGRRVWQRRRVRRRAVQGSQRVRGQVAMGQSRRNGAAGICLRGSADRRLAAGLAARLGLARTVLLRPLNRARRSLYPAPHDRDAGIYRRQADRHTGARL